MRLLFDQNISHRILPLLIGDFPGAEHVRNAGLSAASDTVIWAFAKANGFMMVSKDADFQQRALLLGHPPKVVWVRTGNCSTRELADLLKSRTAEIQTFAADAVACLLVVS